MISFAPLPVSRTAPIDVAVRTRFPLTPVERLADDMREIAAVQGGAAEADLLALGWSRANLRDLGESARAIAARRAGRR